MTDPSPQPETLRASDADRQAAVERLEKALAEGRITAEEFRQRTEAAYAATTTAALRPLLADLPDQPVPAEVVGRRAPANVVNVMGDVRLSASELPRRVGTVLGNIRIDLRDLRSGDERVELDLWTVLGDIDVILPEGMAASSRASRSSATAGSNWRPCRGRPAPRGSSSGRTPSSATSGCAASRPASR
jgi:hypothetical protein